MKRGLMELPSTGLVSFYQCVLADDRPGDVPHNWSGPEYTALLHGCMPDELLPIADRDPAQLVVYGANDENDDEMPVPAKKRRVTRSRATAPIGDDWGSIVAGMEEPEPPFRNTGSPGLAGSRKHSGGLGSQS